MWCNVFCMHVQSAILLFHDQHASLHAFCVCTPGQALSRYSITLIKQIESCVVVVSFCEHMNVVQMHISLSEDKLEFYPSTIQHECTISVVITIII